MKANTISKKSLAILEALAQGRSCAQLLADDPTLTYRDIFHAAAELPEPKKHQAWSRPNAESWQNQAKAGPQPGEQSAGPRLTD